MTLTGILQTTISLVGFLENLVEYPTSGWSFLWFIRLLCKLCLILSLYNGFDVRFYLDRIEGNPFNNSPAPPPPPYVSPPPGRSNSTFNQTRSPNISTIEPEGLTPNTKSNKSSMVGPIIGIVVGSAFVGLCATVAVFFCLCNYSKCKHAVKNNLKGSSALALGLGKGYSFSLSLFWMFLDFSLIGEDLKSTLFLEWKHDLAIFYGLLSTQYIIWTNSYDSVIDAIYSC